MGLDLKTTTQGLKDSLKEHINYAYSVYMHMGVPIVAGLVATRAKYLFEFFEHYHKHNPNGAIHNVKDTITSIDVAFGKISKKTIAIDNRLRSALSTGYFTNIGVRIKNALTFSFSRNVSVEFEIFKKISDSHCECIIIEGISVTTHFDNKKVTHSIGDDNCVMPLDIGLLGKLKPKEKEKFFHQCLYLQIDLYKVSKKKWYERDLFKAVVMVVGIALTVFLDPSGLSFKALLTATVKSVVVGQVVSIGIEIAVQVAVSLGLDPVKAGVIAFVVGIVASAYGGGGFNFSNLSAPQVMKVLNHSITIK